MTMPEVLNMLQVSGLSELIGKQLEGLGDLPSWVMIMLIAALVAGLTEVTSNTGTTVLILPILATLVSSF